MVMALAHAYGLAVPTPHTSAALGAVDHDTSRTAMLSSHTSGWTFNGDNCPAGQRNAVVSECLAAVQEAAQHSGVEVLGLKQTNDGDHSKMPCGCSYSQNSKMAVFNRNTAYRSWSSTHYQRVCITSAPTRMIVLSRGRGGSSVLAKTLAVFAKSNPKWLHHGARKTRTLATRPPE